tara:strand:- start:5615 stop:6373 length:759 start_codon:yes stop_codon:yes gene_type:complete
MANISAYKALGRSLGSYRKDLTAMDKSDIEISDIEFGGQFERGLSDTLFKTLANVVGIAQESRLLSKDIGLGKESAGVYSEEVEYQPLGWFGEKIGLDPKKRTQYLSRKDKRELGTRELANIGTMERLGISNKYTDYKSPTRPDRPSVSSSIKYKTEDEAVNMEVGDISISGEQGLMDERKVTTRASAGEGEQSRGASPFLKGFKTYSTAVEGTSSVIPKSKQSTFNPQKYEKREDSSWLMDFLKSVGGGVD